MTKHIFVTGGVVSSLGKGLTSASIGMLLENRGLSVRMQKIDPYINVDPGTMSPYQHGEVYVLDDGSEISLNAGEGNWRSGRLKIQRDGLYHVAVREQSELIRLSDDYFIEAQNDTKPSVRIVRPGRDARVSPIEEVLVAVEADDDFGLRQMNLRYSVNGAAEKAVPLLKQKGRKRAESSTIIYLEDFSSEAPLRFSYRLRARFPMHAQTPPSSAYDYYNPTDTTVRAPLEVTVSE